MVLSDGFEPTTQGITAPRWTARQIGFHVSNLCVCVCVFCFIINRYWGIVTVQVSIPYGSRPGVAGSSPFTLTTSLVIPVPSSSSSNGPRNYSVVNFETVCRSQREHIL